MINKKSASSGFWVFIAIVIFLLVTSTQKITVNDKQIATANSASCGLLKKVYDPVRRVCVMGENAQNINKNP